MIYDDDPEYAQEEYMHRKRREGWTQCTECLNWLHLEDWQTGSDFCECTQTLENEENRHSERHGTALPK